MTDTRNGNGGWQKALLGGLWATVLLLAGWAVSDARETRDELRRTVQDSVARIAVLEESARNTRDSLKRIEDGVEELRREQRRVR